jgi:hypothetical protein
MILITWLVRCSSNGMTWVKATAMHTCISKTFQFSGYESANQEMVTPFFDFENTNHHGGLRTMSTNFRVTRSPLFLKILSNTFQKS